MEYRDFIRNIKQQLRGRRSPLDVDVLKKQFIEKYGFEEDIFEGWLERAETEHIFIVIERDGKRTINI